MISYGISRSALRGSIRKRKPTWLTKAAERTLRFRIAGRYVEPPPPIWSEIKLILMALQNWKCAYCERKLADHPIEHDIEHFRPKGAVKRWPPSDSPLAYSFPTGEALGQGYYLLAYEPMNYAVACKTCNTPLKGNYFPIAGKRATDSTAAGELKSERPFLANPLSMSDDPENYVDFHGVIPIPKAKRGHSRRRGIIIIDFFELNMREELWRERAEVIYELYFLLRSRTKYAQERLVALQSGAERHTNCARSYVRLYMADRGAARRILRWVKGYLTSGDYPGVRWRQPSKAT